MEKDLKAKILVVEDEKSIRVGLVDLLVFHGYEVDSEENGKRALEKALTQNYHLILLDVMLPDLDGFTICEKVREQNRSLPIIMLTAKGDENDIVKGLQLGADDYITKPFQIQELMARIEAVLRRSNKLHLEQKMMKVSKMSVDPVNLKLIKPDSQEELLTRREVEIISYLLANKNRPVSRQELLKEVWGYQSSNMDTRTVDIHIAKLRKKMENDPQEPSYLKTIRGEGYKLDL